MEMPSINGWPKILRHGTTAIQNARGRTTEFHAQKPAQLRNTKGHPPATIQPMTAFSRNELLLALCLIVVATGVLFSTRNMHHAIQQEARLTRTLENMRRLQQAAAQMVHDGATFTTNNTLAWPGDLNGSFQEWTTALVENKYLTTEELAKLLSSPGRALPANVIPFANNAPVLVYTVTDSSPADTVLLTTDNFINTQQGGLLDATATNHGTKDFAVVRKDGSGNIFPSSEAGKTNRIGEFTPLCH